MPPKRRAVSVESDTDVDLPQAPKRARTGRDNGEVPVATTSKTKSRRAGGNAEDNDPIEVDDDEDMQEDAPPDADEEKKFEEQHEELIRSKVMNQNKHQGVSALHSASEHDDKLIYVIRALQRWGSLRSLSCTSSCVTSISSSPLAPRLTSSLVCLLSCTLLGLFSLSLLTIIL